jgi:DHA1 family tetracycline resistance protein-like MFS transporter
MANQVIWVFVMIARFGWSTGRVGVMMAVGAIAGAVLSAWLSGPIVRWLGHRWAAVVCSAAGAASLIGFAAAPSGLVYLAMMVGAFAGIGGSAMQAWLSDLAGEDEQGTVQGALTGLGSLAEMCVPVAATAVFAWSLNLAMPGLVLVMAAGLALIAALVIGTATSTGASAQAEAVPARS